MNENGKFRFIVEVIIALGVIWFFFHELQAQGSIGAPGTAGVSGAGGCGGCGGCSGSAAGGCRGAGAMVPSLPPGQAPIMSFDSPPSAPQVPYQAPQKGFVPPTISYTLGA